MVTFNLKSVLSICLKFLVQLESPGRLKARFLRCKSNILLAFRGKRVEKKKLTTVNMIRIYDKKGKIRKEMTWLQKL